MARKFVFADESGCMTFARSAGPGQGASKYFIICTIITESCDIAHALLSLRRDLAWQKVQLGEYFHAAKDSQLIRDAVFAEVLKHDFTIQATIMEKSKSQPQVRASSHRFYQYGWFYHLQHGVSAHVRRNDELQITAASIGTRKQQSVFTSAANDVARQTLRLPRSSWATDFCPASSDPCLQVADYCSWAVQRKWEMGDDRPYKLIANRITYEYDLWARGTVHHY